MNQKDGGIILKNYLPLKQRVVILNDRGECLQAMILKPVVLEKLRPGYRVCYNLVPGVSYARLVDIEIVHVPIIVDCLNLEFLHQILELCILTIPVGQITISVAHLLKMITTSELASWPTYIKRLVVCYLLGAVGFYPEVNSVQDYNFILKISKIDATKSDSFSSFSFNVELDLLLLRWIVNFINSSGKSRLVNLFAAIC